MAGAPPVRIYLPGPGPRRTTVRMQSVLRNTAIVLTLVILPEVRAQIAVAAQDNKQVLVDGVPKPVTNAPSDTIALIDLGQSPPKVLAEIDVPAASVAGPPSTVAISPDESLALISSGMKVDPADPTKIAPDNRVTVVDLKSRPPKVLGVVEAGAQPTGISITPDGKIALVTNRSDGTVSVLSIKGQEVKKVDTVKIADEKSGPSHVVITPDGKAALVTRDGDHFVSVLSLEGGKVEYTKRDISAGLRSYGISMHPSGQMAAVANVGRGGGDADTIAIIDLTKKPFRTVDVVPVGQTPEGIMFSADGKYLAVVAMNGSNKPAASPFFNDGGKLLLFRVEGTRLTKLAEAPIGHWSQGVVFSNDGKTLLVQNMVEKDLWVFSFDGTALKDTGQRIKVKGGSAAIRTAGLR